MVLLEVARDGPGDTEISAVPLYRMRLCRCDVRIGVDVDHSLLTSVSITRRVRVAFATRRNLRTVGTSGTCL